MTQLTTRSCGRAFQKPQAATPRSLELSDGDTQFAPFEWRRVFAEAWSTFLLVVVAAGAKVVAVRSGGAASLGMVVVAPGLMVRAIVYFMGAVSGAHLNPAATLAFAVRRSFL